MGNLFNIILIQPITNILLFFNFIFVHVHIPYSFGFAIIGMTALIRLLMHPLSRQQIVLSKKMEEAKPHMARLNEKHKGDKKKLQEEQMKLYKQLGVNPASGCLFALVQIPIFLALYQVLMRFVTNGDHPEKIVAFVNQLVYAPFLKVAALDPNFFGFSLWTTPAHFKTAGWFYLAIPVLTGIFQYLQISVSLPQSASKDSKELAKKNDKDKGAKKESADEMQQAMSAQMKYIFPLMIGYFSFTLPVGLSLYWNIFSIFSILQYWHFHKTYKKTL